MNIYYINYLYLSYTHLEIIIYIIKKKKKKKKK